MITNEKMEEYWMRYKSEGVAKGLSMQSFCSLNNIPYNAFEKYLKLRRHFSTSHPVNIVGIPEDGNANKIAIAKEEAEDEDRESNVMEIAARDSIIQERDKTIKTMAATLKDITHTSESLRQEKFASRSKNPNLLPGVLTVN